jgi:hypothetical protein
MWEQNRYDNFVTQTEYSEAWQIHGIKKLTVSQLREPEAEILDVVGTKLGAFLLAIHINIAYGNLKFENSQDYAQKHQRNCTARS